MGIFVPGVIQHRPAKGVSVLLEIVTNCKRRLGDAYLRGWRAPGQFNLVRPGGSAHSPVAGIAGFPAALIPTSPPASAEADVEAVPVS
jgi:hypothetical protein